MNMLCNRTTHTITVDIQTILARLVQCYDIVEVDTLGNREQKVRELQYSLLDPLETIYTEVEDLEQLAIAVGNRYSTAQIIIFALQINWNMGDFEEGQKRGIQDP